MNTHTEWKLMIIYHITCDFKYHREDNMEIHNLLSKTILEVDSRRIGNRVTKAYELLL